jgi:hypothetical protein
MVYGELFAANNLDRGLFIADPYLNKGSDFGELGYYAAFTQEFLKYGIAGFRYDYYDPNSDLLDKRAGKYLPVSQRIRTYSPMLGATIPGFARVVAQWDIIDDHLARDERGVPVDFHNNQWTIRLQGML